MSALALSGASLQGTSAGGLWEAVVLFRLRASRVIGASDTVASSTRLWHLVGVAVESGALVLLVLTIGLAVHSAYRRTPLRVTPNLTWPALALAAWEVCAVALGGSYWHHYLTGLVPGLVLLTTIATPGAWGRRLLTATLAYATMVNLSVWAGRATSPVTGTTDAQVEAFLRAHARPSDGVVVAFGHPDIVAGSGLASPYPELWSLPVHVRDPDLHVLQRVLSGAAAPRWVVVGGSSLASWGLEAGPAEAYLLRHYVERAAYGGWRVWQREAPSSGRTTRPQS